MKTFITLGANIGFLLPLLFQLCSCIRFDLAPHTRKCLKHEMYANQLAVGQYEVSSLPGTVVDVSITDSQGHVAFNRENVDGKGKFAVTSDTADFYELCFAYSSSPSTAPLHLTSREVAVEWKVGAEAKDYSSIDPDKLTSVERELAKIEDLTNSIIVDFAYLKKREQEMRDTNESTNTRIFYQTIASIIVLLVLTTWQVLYLRTFFRARKLID